ncbi:(5-formylfuran-3-yl)methyl phosphate synthase [soil metagenome]
MAKAKVPAKTKAKIGLLVSVRSPEEAKAAVAAGATLIDVKEPSNGPLGMAEAEVVAAVIEAVGKKVPVSAALGEWRDTILTDAVWHLEQPLTYIKWGLAGYRDTPGWGEDLLDCRRQIKTGPEVVCVAYADSHKAKSIAADQVAKFAKRFKFKAFLLDTFNKDGKTLLDHLDIDEITEIVTSLKAGGVKVALGGSLTLEVAKKLKVCEPDWIAVRGGVCTGGKRGNELDPLRVKKWKEMLA